MQQWSSAGLPKLLAKGHLRQHLHCRIMVSSECFTASCTMHLGYMPGTPLPGAGWMEGDNFLPQMHQHLLAVLSAKAETRLEAEDSYSQKCHTAMNSWIQKHKMPVAGTRKGTSVQRAAGEATHLGDHQLVGCVAKTAAALATASFSPWADTSTYRVVVSPHTATKITLWATDSEAARVTARAGMRSASLGHLLTAAHWLLWGHRQKSLLFECQTMSITGGFVLWSSWEVKSWRGKYSSPAGRY